MVGGFGAWGAAIGAVVAVGAGLIPVLQNMRDSGGNAADAIDDLRDAVDAYQEAADIAFGSTADLVEQFGSLADEARTAFQFIAASKLDDALAATSGALSTLKSDLSEAFLALTDFERAQDALVSAERLNAPASIISTQRNTVEQLRFALDDMLASFDLNVEQAQQLRAAIEGIKPGTEGAASAAAQFLDYLTDIYGTTSEIPKSLRDAAVQLAESSAEAARLQQGMEEAEASTRGLAGTDIASGIGAGADEAARLAEYMGISLATAAKIAALGPQGIPSTNTDPSGKTYSGRGGDPREFGGGAFDIQTREAAEFLANWEPPKVSSGRSGRKSGGGGAGGISEAERELEQFTRGLERFRTEEQQALADLMELESGFERFGGQLSPEQVELYGQAIEGLRDSLASAGDGITDFGREAAAVFPGITEVMEDTREAASRLLATLADRAWTAGLEQLFSGFGGQDSKGIFGGAIVPGILHDGGIAGVDGYDHSRRVSAAIFKDAERYHNGGVAGLKSNEVPAILERGERVIPNGQSDGGAVDVRIGVDNNGNLQAYVESASGRVAARVVESAAPAIADRSVKATRRSMTKSKAGWGIG